MQIIKRFVAIAIASSILSTSIPTRANPAILAPAAFCAGTAGVGCVLIGVAVVGGVSYYIWQHSNGKHTVSSGKGNVLISDFGEYLPPDGTAPYKETESVNANNANEALVKCLKIAKQWGGVLKPGKPRSIGKKLFLCEFTVWR